KDRDLILVNLQRNAYVDVRNDATGRGEWMTSRDLVMQDFQAGKQDPPVRKQPGAADDEDDEPPFGRKTQAGIKESRRLPEADGWAVEEFVVDVRRGGPRWRFLVRVYQKAGLPRGGTAPVRLVRGYTPGRRFGANEAELRRALDSFRLKPGM